MHQPKPRALTPTPPPSEKKLTRTLTPRPAHSYVRKSSSKSQTHSAKDLSRIKTKSIVQDKESLYDQLIAVKQELSEVNLENLKLRSRLKFLQQEETKIPQISASTSAYANLKNMYMEAKKTISERDETIAVLKKTSKVSHSKELKVQNQVLKDEWCRLRRLVEVRLTNRDHWHKEVVSGLVTQLVAENEDLKIENSALQDRLDEFELSSDFRSDLNDETEPNISTTFSTEKESVNLAAEEKDLIEKTQLCGLKATWDLLTSNYPLNRIKKADFGPALTDIGIFPNLQKKNQLYNTIVGSNDGISYDLFKDYYYKKVPMLPCFRHLSMAMQGKRLQIQHILSFFTAITDTDLIDTEKFTKLMTASRLSLKPQIVTQIASKIFSEDSRLSIKQIAEKMEEFMASWIVLNEEDETNFDTELYSIFYDKREEFLSYWSKFDSQGTKVISMSEFCKSCEQLDLEISEKTIKYLELLFYWDQNELDAAPYENFINAYAK